MRSSTIHAGRGGVVGVVIGQSGAAFLEAKLGKGQIDPSISQCTNID